MDIRKARPEDYPQILRLQFENTPAQLTADQKRQGFIVSHLDAAQLDTINRDLGVLVIDDGGTIGGFTCLTRTTLRPRAGIVAAMLEKLPLVSLNGRQLDEQRVFLYGPVCLADAYRGRGLLRTLFNAVVQLACQEFDAGIAFVNSANPHSLAAHVKGLGMKDVLTFTFQGETYHLLVFGPCASSTCS